MNLSAKIEEYATSRRLTRHQMSLLSRSLGGTESPSTPASAKRKTKAKTPPRSVHKDAAVTSTLVDTPQSTSLSTTPLRSSARIRKMGNTVTGEKSVETQETLKPSQSVDEVTTSTEVERDPTKVSTAVENESSGQVTAESTDVTSDEKSSLTPWSLLLEERVKKLKRGSPAPGQSTRRRRQSSVKSASPQSTVSSSLREQAASESKSVDKDCGDGNAKNEESEVALIKSEPHEGTDEKQTGLRERSPMVESSPLARRTRRLSTKSSSPHSSVSTEIRLSPVPEDMLPMGGMVSASTIVGSRAESPTPSVASTVESSRSGRARRRSTRLRSSVERDEESAQVGKTTMDTEEIGVSATARLGSPTPSVASTIGSCASGRVLRRSTRTRASMEREEPPLTPTQELQRSGRLRQRSETESPVRRSARLMGSSPLTAQALSTERSSPPSESDSEVSGYSSSVASSRSRTSAVQEERLDRGEALTLRSGRKRSKLPAVSPSKSGPRQRRTSRGSAAARFLVMPEEDEDVDGLDTAFVFSLPKMVNTPSEAFDAPKEPVEFTLSPPKIVVQPTVVSTGRRRSMAARRSIANLGAIPEHGEAVPTTTTEIEQDKNVEDIVPATPPKRRGRSSLPGSRVSVKVEEALWSSPRRGVNRGKSKVEAARAMEEQRNQDADVSKKIRTRHSSAGSLQTIEESKDEENISGGEVQKRLHPILRNKRSSPTGSVVSEGAIDQGDDSELEDKGSNRAKDDSDTLPRKKKGSSRKSLQSRKVVVPYKPRKSAKL